MLAVWFDSNAVKMTTAEHDLTKFSNTHFHFHSFEQFDRNYSFEDVNLSNFEEDNLNVDDVYQVDIYNSRSAKHFVGHQEMILISISTTRFGLRTGLFMLLT